ncbi:MAG: phosphoribosylaminoimidazolesuccinocarboxamide synthase [Chlorobi bacterium]|nr:phosphoribosylaminoimidazolesuccinocarboxamide synthase [Chlorobiota bacterium]
MTEAILHSGFHFPGQTEKYEGKVRDTYTIDGKYLVMVVTDRISAFDVILPRGIPFKGQVLNLIAARFLDATSDIIPNWKIEVPHPNVMIGRKAEPFMVEMVVRGYLTGHAWREYRDGKRELCGVPLPEGMREHQKFPEPVITPTTKAVTGHDEDISQEEIVAQGLLSSDEMKKLSALSLDLFRRGTELAARKGLILVDTKYEFGKVDGEIVLIDEIHTPDSSRYFYTDGYQERFDKGENQKQLSKEFVREWLIQQGFHGQEGKSVPNMSDEFVLAVSDRYIELYEKITGEPFQRGDLKDISGSIEEAVNLTLKKLR